MKIDSFGKVILARTSSETENRKRSPRAELFRNHGFN